MGQRSQIYIRYNGDIKVANYYNWCYGERLVSRARSIVERLDYKHIRYDFGDEKIKRYCDVNFDMRDISISHDILQDYKDGKDDFQGNFNQVVFAYANNDGQLFIDVTQEKDEQPKIKYCFVEYYTSDKILDGTGYLNWDTRGNYKIKHWERYLSCHKDLKREIIKYTRKNLAYLQEHATLMTYDELQDFVNSDYDENGKQIKPF